MDQSHAPLLRERILQSGLTAPLFERIAASENVSFQNIFGGETLLVVEFDVLLLGEHTHLVYVAPGTRPAEIITSYPEKGTLRVAPPTPWYGSRHSPVEKGGRHRVAIVQNRLPCESWGRICLYAQRIDNARLNYHFLKQTSNSVAATLLSSIGHRYLDLRGGGFNFGASNLLHDELDGGPQARRLLFRGGASYLGTGPARPIKSAQLV